MRGLLSSCGKADLKVGLYVLVCLVAAGCGRTDTGSTANAPAAPASNATTMTDAATDIHSFARPQEARVTHVALDLRTDFAAKQLAGTARLTLDRRPSAAEVVLDTDDLVIERVTDAAGQPLMHRLGDANPVLGRPLIVTLRPDVKEIVVSYRTSPQAEALQWLSPEQTAGKTHPYLFSQGQAILTRSWIPTQDSPGIRQTYSARIVVPKELRAVMSAEQSTPDGVAVDGGRAFEFKMPQAIPPYLIAIAVGDIASRPIGPRTAVYAEPSVVEAAAYEFADLEKMVTAAEALLGPYRWGRYDGLVLPPSFPFGGMENPRLTFLTPTVLAGDRSLVSLVAHELAHSWSGNLVTNATWRDFWLNEGMTTYVELRIMEALYGVERAGMLEVLAMGELRDEMARLGGPSAKDTILHVDLEGRNPDDGMTQIPYEKGSALLRLIERTVGRDRFDPWLRGYLDRHAFTSITTAQFVEDLRTHLVKGDTALEQKLRLDEWIYQPGVPDNAPQPMSQALARVETAAKAFAGGTAASSLPAKAWTTQEWLHFLEALPEQLTPAQLADLDKTFNLTAQRNSEVLFSWLRIAIRHRYEPAMPALDRFLSTQGRRKFLRPLYEDLMKTDWGKAEAKRIYAKARPLYHSVATTTLDPIVGA